MLLAKIIARKGNAFHILPAKIISSKRAGPNKSKPQNKPQHTVATKKRSKPVETALAIEMAAYGVTHFPVDYFHFGAFRYTNLNDALAQAKRIVQN